jgi:hypothetical protein
MNHPMSRHHDPCQQPVYHVRVQGGEEEGARWAAAAGLAGFRPRPTHGRDGGPVLAVALRDPSEASELAELMRRVGVGGSLERYR